MTTVFLPVTVSKDASVPSPRVSETAALAAEIWREHYIPLLGEAQVAYMLDRFQSAAAIASQIERGYRYTLLCDGGDPARRVGYMAAAPESGKLFLSKIYIRKDARGRGHAARAVSVLRAACRASGLPSIFLTVNKHNAGSIAAYEKLGFRRVREQTADIGGGFVMDDYVMELPV